MGALLRDPPPDERSGGARIPVALSLHRGGVLSCPVPSGEGRSVEVCMMMIVNAILFIYFFLVGGGGWLCC